MLALQIRMERLVACQILSVSNRHFVSHGMGRGRYVASLGQGIPELGSSLSVVLPADAECGHVPVFCVHTVSR